MVCPVLVSLEGPIMVPVRVLYPIHGTHPVMVVCDYSLAIQNCMDTTSHMRFFEILLLLLSEKAIWVFADCFL